MTDPLANETIQGLQLAPDGSIDPVRTMIAIQDMNRRIEELSRLVSGNRVHFGLHAKPAVTSNDVSIAELTIESGEITVDQSYHTVDTQSDASSDDLDTINGGERGDLLILSAENSSRTVVVKDSTGNLELAGDMSLDNVEDTITLIKGKNATWYEISRSNNGA